MVKKSVKKVTAKAKRPQRVNFYLDPETSKKDQNRVFNIVSLLCKEYGGKCSINEDYPIKISLAIAGEPKEYTCIDGWTYVYEFENEKDTKQFAEDISLLKPVCGVNYNIGRFETCIEDRWTTCIIRQK